MKPGIELYPFQKQCISDLTKGFQKQKTICLSWYTGAGKTNVIAEYCRQEILKNPKIKIGISAYLTTEIKLQVFERLGQMGLGAQTIMVNTGKDFLIQNKNVYVFLPHAPYMNLKDLKIKFDLFVVDESHAGLNEGSKMIAAVIKKTTHRRTQLLLSSATPWDTLAMKAFKKVMVLKRPLDQGLTDNVLTDYQFVAEEAQVEFTNEDFTRDGDLRAKSTIGQLSVLKSACFGKLTSIVKKYDKELGNKVLVVCPPGNIGEIATEMANRFGGLAYIQSVKRMSTSKRFGRKTKGLVQEDIEVPDTDKNLELFKTDPKLRFLFVVNKCSVGFDMQELSSIVDLTMTRNIKVLAQRTGRVARKNGNQKKFYFYIYDKSLTQERLLWVVSTMIDFSLGHYDGWTTGSVQYRRVNLNKEHGFTYPLSISVTAIIKALSIKKNMKNVITLSYLTNASPPTKWTLEKAVAKMQEYQTRTIMWAENPALYKWFRLNAKSVMDKHFPFRKNPGWTKAKAIEAMKLVKSRDEFKIRFSGCDGWLRENGLIALREQYLPKSKSTKRWNGDTIKTLLEKIKYWGQIRSQYPGARKWMSAFGGETYWREYWWVMRGERKNITTKYRTNDYWRKRQRNVEQEKARYAVVKAKYRAQ